MPDSLIQRLARDADPSDLDAAAVALVRSGRGPSFREFLIAPTAEYGHWSSPRFDAYRLSIQAGYGQYSAPRRGGLTASEYTEWEVGIVGTAGLIYVIDSPEFQGMPCADHWEGEGAVGPYVPSEGVQSIFDWMTLNFGRPQHPSAFALED